MAKYVTLYKFTDQGIRDIKGSPDRIQQATAAWESLIPAVLCHPAVQRA